MFDDARKDAPQSDRRRAPAAEEAFKPLALPALAAAVRASRKEPRRQATRELPAILRKDALD